MRAGTSWKATDVAEIDIVDPRSEVIPGVIWGRPEWFLSASYWAVLTRTATIDSTLFAKSRCLRDEVVFCLLGGFGVTAELNIAAYAAVEDLLCLVPTEHELRERLKNPMKVGDRWVRYRFPNQRATRLAAFLSDFVEPPRDLSAQDLRKYLMSFSGIGPKTASWVVRNSCSADDVAIIDVHVERACRHIGVFSPDQSVNRDYYEMEDRFVSFAKALGVSTSRLDAVIWSTMRRLGPPKLV